MPAVLAEHAKRFYTEGREPAVPRVAATVMLLRPATPGYEVYALRRAATMVFASGAYAFPGGSVDPGDSDTTIAWSGPPRTEWAARLDLPVGAAQAVVCAAVREVFEESGVLLAGPSPSTVVGDVSGPEWENARQRLERRESSLTELLRDNDLVLRSDLLAPWSRWITPEFEPRRFDTYFFLARLPEGQLTRDVSTEADDTVWIRPTDAIARVRAGEFAMLPPTVLTLQQLAEHSTVDTLVAAADRRDVSTPIIPRADGANLVT